MAVGAPATYAGKRYSESVTSVTARLYIGVHARVASVTAAWVALDLPLGPGAKVTYSMPGSLPGRP